MLIDKPSEEKYVIIWVANADKQDTVRFALLRSSYRKKWVSEEKQS